MAQTQDSIDFADPTACPDELIRRAETLLDKIRELHAALAEDPAPGGARERDLLRLLDDRDDLARRLGFVMLRWIARGDAVDFVEPDGVESTPPEGAPAASTSRAAPDPEPVDEQPVAAEVEPRPEPASSAALTALTQRGLTPNWSDARSATARQVSLKRLLCALDEPARPRSEKQARRMLAAVELSVRGMDTWLGHPKDVQKALMGLTSSMARLLQEEREVPLDSARRGELTTMFSLMTRWSSEHRPGFVPGLSRKHDPEHGGSWVADARHWWELLQSRVRQDGGAAQDTPESLLAELGETLKAGVHNRQRLADLVRSTVDAGVTQSDPRLVSLLAPFQSTLKGARGLKTLKTNLRQAERQAEQELAAEDTRSPVPSDWPFLSLTRGRDAVIVGGDPRKGAARRIRDAFAFGTATWTPCDPRRIKALAERIRQGNVEFLILLRRLIGHDIQDMLMPSCAQAGVSWVLVDTGYGVTQVRLAIERDLRGWVEAEE